MVRYFKKDLKSSIKAKINQDANQLDNYEGLVAKVIRAKAKVGLQPSSYMQKTDQQYIQKSLLAYTTYKMEVACTRLGHVLL